MAEILNKKELPDLPPIPGEVNKEKLAEELIGSQNSRENNPVIFESSEKKEKGKYSQTEAYFTDVLQEANERLEKLSHEPKDEEKKQFAKDEYKYILNLLQKIESGDIEGAKIFVSGRLEIKEREIENGKKKESDEEYKTLLKLAKELGIETAIEEKIEAAVTPIKSADTIKDDNIETDLAIAKRHLEELYGSVEKQTEMKPETEPLVTESSPEEEKENYVKVVETPEGKEIHITEEEKPVVPVAEKTPEQKRADAWEVLSDPEVLKRSPREVVKSFRIATKDESGNHRHLARERNEMAYNNLRERGKIIIKGKEAIEKARQNIILRERKKIKEERYVDALSACCDSLSETRLSKAEKKEYIKDGNFDKKKYVEDKIKNLGISNHAFAEMVLNRHIDFLNIKNGSWFSSAIEIPNYIVGKQGKPVRLDKKEFQEWIVKEVEPQAEGSIFLEAEKRANEEVIKGKKRVIAEKSACVKKIITELVENHNAQGSPKHEEIVENKVEQKNEEKKEPAKSNGRRKSFAELMQESKDLMKEYVAAGIKNGPEFKKRWDKLKEQLEIAKKREDQEGQTELKRKIAEGRKKLAEEEKKIEQELAENIRKLNEKTKKNLEEIGKQRDEKIAKLRRKK